jgi:hypothetical protein
LIFFSKNRPTKLKNQRKQEGLSVKKTKKSARKNEKKKLKTDKTLSRCVDGPQPICSARERSAVTLAYG